MWLDRLAGHSTTPDTSGPARPQKVNYLVPTSTLRLPRTSSLSVYSNDSTGSLLVSDFTENSYNKQSLVNTGEKGPLQVLHEILNPSKHEILCIPPEKNYGEMIHDELVDDIDFEGLNLQEIASLPFSGTEEDFTISEIIEECEKDKASLVELHNSILACDEVLSSVESNLVTFRDDLAQVSVDIETIQARSNALSISLDNRKNTEQILGPIVEEISIPIATVRKIVDGSMDEAWVKALADVEKRSKSFDSKIKDRRNIKGIISLKPLLETLICKAIERIRDFLVSQIKVLRSPNVNAQIVQQQQFIRYKDIYLFLHKRHPQLAEEIGQAYMNTMRWYFLNQFTRYEKALAKIKIHLIDKHDALGQDDGTRKSTTVSNSRTPGPIYDAFNLGRRIDLLKTSNQTALSSFLAEEDHSIHYLEFPFRNFNLALMDNASAEYSFLTTFFTPALTNSSITKHFNYIFEPTFSLGHNFTKSFVSDTYDCLGLLICVRLNQSFAFELQRRKVPTLESYINGTSMLLWPRFQLVMDTHCDSVRVLTSSLSIRKQSASEAAKQSTAPHFMTQRFGQFLQSILLLSAEASDDEPVSTSLGRLRGEIESFLTKFSMVMDKRKRDRFMYNNYSLILTIVGEAQGKLAAQQKAHFEEVKKLFATGVN
ncbi:Vacuolar protein sorting-associated protein 52 A [Erysiphe necator]|uniref:Putative vps52 sac2 family protein n=1 Tax=Uncinula necator TaxID=52586 RepID=A0A0B1PGR8_UNCNE|nr:Vacuolar protein sorting-associated protein 52 A [Erysiphe necator]KHJ35724.1 putative vps52 sac2 family protein [Erysiphe necator]